MSSSQDSVWPVIVNHQNGDFGAALMNRKAFLKSRETGVAWIVHPSTGRVLPWPGDAKVVDLREGPGCYVLTLPAGSICEAYGGEKPEDNNPDDRSSMISASRPVGEDAVMEDLAHTIAQRHKEMPKGSYTTHLFEKGLDKIRKKTGEEAVELLLARDKQDIIYESADLIYHLLVLLEAENLTWNDVTAELARRHS